MRSQNKPQPAGEDGAIPGLKHSPLMFYRAGVVRAADVDEETRTLPLTFSSEAGVSRWFGKEILLHGEKNVDLTRLRTMGSLLVNHNPNFIAGPVESAKLGDDRRGHAVVGFDEDADGEKAFGKVRSGSLRGVSVGYLIHKFRRIGEKEEWTDEDSGRTFKGPAYIAVRWEPIEISLTPIPADSHVGVGRDMTRSLDGIEIKASPDPATDDRSSNSPEEGGKPMDERTRKYLESRGLDAKATEEEAWKFQQEELPKLDKKREAKIPPEKPEDKKVERKTPDIPTEDIDGIRKVLNDAAGAGLRDLAAELIATGKNPVEVRDAVFAKLKEQRGAPAGPGKEEADAADLEKISDADFARGLCSPVFAMAD